MTMNAHIEELASKYLLDNNVAFCERNKRNGKDLPYNQKVNAIKSLPATTYFDLVNLKFRVMDFIIENHLTKMSYEDFKSSDFYSLLQMNLTSKVYTVYFYRSVNY